jgi:DNA polymerase I-like protein with 3'-5' exonuclease and polymerase domains
MPIQTILAKMELYGFGLNKECLVKLNSKVNKLLEDISKQGLELSGTKFNMQSTLEWAKVCIN